jgi:hypothetical protein
MTVEGLQYWEGWLGRGNLMEAADLAKLADPRASPLVEATQVEATRVEAKKEEKRWRQVDCLDEDWVFQKPGPEVERLPQVQRLAEREVLVPVLLVRVPLVRVLLVRALLARVLLARVVPVRVRSAQVPMKRDVLDLPGALEGGYVTMGLQILKQVLPPLAEKDEEICHSEREQDEAS